MFHHIVSQLLFARNQYCRDIHVPVLFLTTRVKNTNEHDWGKLKRVLKYLKGVRGMKLALYVKNLFTINRWVYTPSVVHKE